MTFPKYPEYKDSGVEWLGEVPAHWEVVKLSYLASSKGGGTPPKDELQYWNGRIPWVTPKDMKQQCITSTIDTLAEAALYASPVSMIDPGHVLVVFRSGILRHRIPVAINKVPVTVNQDIRTYNVRPRLLPNFFLSMIQGLNRELLPEWSKQGATVESLDSELVSSSQLPVPPMDEQEAIAAFLDHETARIDALVEHQKSLIELLKEKRQAVISHAVTKGLDPEVPMKDSGVEWLGEVPAHWDVVPLKLIVSTPVTDGPHETPEFIDDGVPFVSAEAVSSGRIDFDKARFIRREDYERFSRKYSPKKHDVYMVKSGATTGITAIVEDDREFNIWSPLAVIRCKDGVDPYFALHFMRSTNFQESVVLNWSYGTQQNIGMGVIENLPIAMPPESEQKEISAFLSNHVKNWEVLTQEASRTVSLLQERRTALISAAVTGKIDVRGWQPPEASSALAEVTQAEAV